MFALLLDEPLTVSTRGPFIEPTWAGSAPHLRFGARLQLAVGVWVSQVREFMPASVLDIGEIIPPPVVDVKPTGMTWYEPDWHARAACKSLAVEDNYDKLFFSADGDENRWTYQSPKVLERARAYCATCPVARDCLLWALSNDERWGVWGGTTGRQRAKMRDSMAAGLELADLTDTWLNEWLGA